MFKSNNITSNDIIDYEKHMTQTELTTDYKNTNVVNAEIIAQEESKINTLSLLSEEKRQLLLSGAPYVAIPYMPITTEFIETTILNNNEYPLMESKLSQAAIEMKARINRLVDAQFNINKLTLEITELELDIEDIDTSSIIDSRRKEIQKAKKALEIQQKKWQIIGHTNESDTNFQEFTQWKKAIEDIIEGIQKNDPSITDFSMIRYDKIRCAEINIKKKMWKAQRDAGKEITPSQAVLLD